MAFGFARTKITKEEAAKRLALVVELAKDILGIAYEPLGSAEKK